MCAKYDELKNFGDKALDKADAEYEKQHGDYDKNESVNEHQARSDYNTIAREIQQKEK